MLAKSWLNSMEVLIFKDLIDSFISHDKFVLINLLKEYEKMKEQVKEDVYSICKTMLLLFEV